MKAYLFSFTNAVTPEQVHQMLNQTQAIQTWLTPFTHSAILLSGLTTSELTAVLRTHLGEVWFVVVEVHKDGVNGWLPQQFWDYLLDPQSAWSRQVMAQLLKEMPLPAPLGLLGRST